MLWQLPSRREICFDTLLSSLPRDTITFLFQFLQPAIRNQRGTSRDILMSFLHVAMITNSIHFLLFFSCRYPGIRFQFASSEVDYIYSLGYPDILPAFPYGDHGSIPLAIY